MGIGFLNVTKPSRPELYRLLEQHYFGPEMRERAEIERLPRILEGVQTFVDVGAALGQYTYFANKIMSGGRIYAIEADPVRYARLAELCGKWEMSSNNKIVALHKAVSDTNEPIPFFVSDEDRSGGLFPVEGLQGMGEGQFEWREIQVEATTLDAMFSGGPPDMVKVDVEGGEYRVLSGSTNILAQGNTRFIVEVHPWGDPVAGRGPTDIFDLFADFAYSYRRLSHHWLFEKSASPHVVSLKKRFIHFVYDHPSVMRTLKQMLSGRRRWR